MIEMAICLTCLEETGNCGWFHIVNGTYSLLQLTLFPPKISSELGDTNLISLFSVKHALYTYIELTITFSPY